MQFRFLGKAATVVATSALVVGGFGIAADAHNSNGGYGSNGDGYGSSNNIEFAMRDHGRNDGHDSGSSHHDHGGSAAPVVVTNGLNNPRQLDLVDGKVLLIAEAGSGGTTCVTGPEGPQCIGATGSVSGVIRPQNGTARQHTELFTGLISGASPDGSFAVGSDGVAQRDIGSPIYVQETFFPPDALAAPLPGVQAGKLLSGQPFGSLSPFADITAYETAHDPDGQGFDSDPYAVVTRDHDKLVADAAANDILRVDRHGNVSLFHVFPNVVNSVTTTATADWPGYDPTPAFPGADFVPTSMAIGPDGDVFVGGLSSLLPGQAELVELDGHTGNLERTWTGFTSITGVAVGDDGSIYVSQLFAPEANPINPMVQGVLTKIAPDGTQTNLDVPFPAGLAVDHANNVYVSAFSGSPATGLVGAPAGVDTSGQVWRLRF